MHVHIEYSATELASRVTAEHSSALVSCQWGVRVQFRELHQRGECRGHAANDVASSEIPERRIRRRPITHCAARTARAYKNLSLVSAVMPAGKVAVANGWLLSDLMGQPPP